MEHKFPGCCDCVAEHPSKSTWLPRLEASTEDRRQPPLPSSLYPVMSFPPGCHHSLRNQNPWMKSTSLPVSMVTQAGQVLWNNSDL
ncbi:mCG1036165, isoform CRA_a [Mus musculus]|nr:mCG1036165, isoform CRA_a [Mus musculus]